MATGGFLRRARMRASNLEAGEKPQGLQKPEGWAETACSIAQRFVLFFKLPEIDGTTHLEALILRKGAPIDDGWGYGVMLKDC